MKTLKEIFLKAIYKLVTVLGVIDYQLGKALAMSVKEFLIGLTVGDSIQYTWVLS